MTFSITMGFPKLRIMAAALLLLTTALSSSAAPGGDRSWESPRLRDHPLTGRIWRARDGAFITAEQLGSRLGDAGIVLLGEKHDNPDHHRLRLGLLERLLDSSGLGLLSMEMLVPGQAERLRALPTDIAEEPERLREELDWRQGWHWPFYAPVLRTMLRADVPVHAANIDDEQLNRVYGGELSAAAESALDTGQLERLRRQIRISHCNRLPEQQLPAMVRVQQARDLRMAQSLHPGEGTRPSGPRILLAGNFHVRRDLGVPNYLQEKSGETITVAFMEVSRWRIDPRDYLGIPSADRVFDYVWFTPAVEAQDYCAGLNGSASTSGN